MHPIYLSSEPDCEVCDTFLLFFSFLIHFVVYCEIFALVFIRFHALFVFFFIRFVKMRLHLFDATISNRCHCHASTMAGYIAVMTLHTIQIILTHTYPDTNDDW